MTIIFDQVEFIHRLEREGLSRGAAEAIAAGIEDGRRHLVTKVELENVITTALAKQTIQFGVMLGAGLALTVAVIGAIISLR